MRRVLATMLICGAALAAIGAQQPATKPPARSATAPEVVVYKTPT
jgi:hypothetical protein